MARMIALLAAMIAAGLSGPAAAQSYRGSTQVRCESDANRTQLCRIDTRGGVRLVRQESRSPCVLGRSWGYDSSGIWVSDGCRARFEVGSAYAGATARSHPYAGYAGSGYHPGGFDTYRDSRYDSRYGNGYGSAWPYSGNNPLTTVIGAVLGTVIGDGRYDGRYNDRYYGSSGYYGSRYPSTSGYGSGYYGSNAYGGGYGAYGGRQPQVFRCESENGQPRFCRLPFQAARIDIRRQLSRTRCNQGYNWGWQPDGVWVERGCRAEFVVY